MNKRIKIFVACGALFVCITVVGCLVVVLLHKRNTVVGTTAEVVVDVDTEVSIPVIETTEESTELFSGNLSDHVGEIIISTYISEDKRDIAVSTINTLEKDGLALYLFSVSYDKSTGEEYLSYNAYDSNTGEFYGDDIPLIAGEANYDNVVLESYQGQITVIK